MKIHYFLKKKIETQYMTNWFRKHMCWFESELFYQFGSQLVE